MVVDGREEEAGDGGKAEEEEEEQEGTNRGRAPLNRFDNRNARFSF
jgi:hypothetical protein